MPRQRADTILVERKIFPSREKAQEAIEGGVVLADGKPVRKASSLISRSAKFEVLGRPRYVSRGGEKLAKAVEEFKIDARGKVALDVGSSTGGFTDCLLQAGARLVMAVDVGRGQLHWKLRSDPRVCLLEGKNVRYLRRDDLPERPDLVVVDVSFISLTLIARPLAALMEGGARVVLLVKPQFEAGAKEVPKGVVRDPDVQAEVLNRVLGCYTSLGYDVMGLTFSPIKGPAGNIEFLAYLSYPGAGSMWAAVVVDDAVRRAHECLNGKAGAGRSGPGKTQTRRPRRGETV